MKLEDAMKQARGMRVTVGDTTFELGDTTAACNGYSADVEAVTTASIPAVQIMFDVDSLAEATVLRWVCGAYYHDVLGDI